jgi:predicted SnoaL-like aldol condensation-catalyzing enzyme
MSVADNKAIARRFIDDVWNRGKVAVASELLAADLVNHRADGSVTKGRESFEKFVADFRARNPGLAFTIDDMVSEGDKVATRVTIKSGDKAWSGIGIVRISGGRIAEQWADTERAGKAAPGKPG